jgi:hypothetical protein
MNIAKELMTQFEFLKYFWAKAQIRMLKELTNPSGANLSEATKNVVTEIIVGVLQLLDQAFGGFVRHFWQLNNHGAISQYLHFPLLFGGHQLFLKKMQQLRLSRSVIEIIGLDGSSIIKSQCLKVRQQVLCHIEPFKNLLGWLKEEKYIDNKLSPTGKVLDVNHIPVYFQDMADDISQFLQSGGKQYIFGFYTNVKLKQQSQKLVAGVLFSCERSELVCGSVFEIHIS